MKNRASRRLHSVTESIGVSPRIVEMCDGSLSCTHPSKRQGREGDHWEFVKTCVRSPTTDGGASARIRTTAPVADADCAFYQKKSFEGTKVVDGERRKPPRRVENPRRRECASGSSQFKVHTVSKMWDPVSVARTLPSLVPRRRRRGEAAPGVFFRGFDREETRRGKSRVPTGRTAKNLPSVHSSGSSFDRQEQPHSQIPQGDSEEVCEFEIEGTGLVQIFRKGENFAGRIVERVGPFSKTTTVPLFCKGFSDPEEAIRRLARLPWTAARRRIHILSNPTRGTERFIFLGDLGLWGGGNGEPSSSSDALGHQTPAEGSASRSVIQRALTSVERFLVQRILDEGSPYQNLEQVVKAFNEAEDAVLRLAPAVVIRRVLGAFGDMHVGEATDNGGAVVRECLALCGLDSADREHVPLLKDFFDSIRDKLCTDTPSSRYLTEAIELTLQTVEAELFEDDPGCLVRLAKFLLDELDPEKASFSRKTFPAQCSALHAVHECLRILGDVGSDDLDPNKLEGLHARVEECCRKVIDVAGYYPMKYEAMLVRHSMTSSQFSKRGAHNASNAKRVVGLFYGTAGIHQAVRKAVHLDFDLGDAESVASALQQVRLQAMVQAMHQARRGEVVWEDQWRTCLRALNAAHFAVMEDPSAFEVFSEILSSLVLEERASDSEHCKALRFGVVEMLTMLSIHAKDGDVRRASAETLASFVERKDEWDWCSDRDLFLELLDNLAELCARGFDHEKRAADDAMERLISNVHNPACEEALSEWRGEKKADEGVDSVSSGEDKTAGNELFLRVWKGLEDELSAPTTEVLPRPKKKHSLASPDIVRYFAGRKDELKAIVEAFAESSESVVAKAIICPGGIGKTQLAIKAFDYFRSKHSYDDEFWIPSGSRESITAAFLQIVEYLQIPTDDDTPELVRRVREKLGRSRCLYVFDDAPNLELIREYVPPAGAHVIVTTRECGASEWARNAVRLEPLDEIEARILAEKFECAKSLRSKDLDDLMDLLPRTPLALAQFFSVMRDEDVWNPGEWVQHMLRYKLTPREAETIAKLSATRSGEVATGMIFVFNSSVRKISKEPNDLGPRSLDLLAKLALLDPNGVPVDWVYKWLELEDESSKTRTENFMRLLERFSHVSWDKRTNQIHMHAETQLLVKQLLINIDESSSSHTQESEEQNKKTIRDHVDTIVHSIGRYIGEWRTDRSNRELWTSLARNGLPLQESCENCKEHRTELKLLEHMSEAYKEMCMFRESISYAHRALKMCERLHGDSDHPDLVIPINNYASGLDTAGRINEALPLYERALEMCERIHGEADHPSLVTSIGNYALGLQAVGRVNEALPLYNRALEMCERIHGDADHPSLECCINNYALGLDDAGRINEALPLYNRALEMCERIHGEADHPSLVTSIGNYASGLDTAGRINEALPLYKRAMEMCERIHGDADHPSLECCINNYASGLQNAGRIHEALPLYNRALEMCERIHGEADHPDLVIRIGNYALGLQAVGRVNEALPLYKRALEMCERIHGEADHPDLVIRIGNYALGLKAVGRIHEALPLYKRALEMCERIHGEADHPDLVIRIGNYALGLKAVGRIHEALPLYKRALEICERIHGDADHPSLECCINNYASGLDTAGRINEALPLYNRALEMCERIHGEADHPDLVIRIGNYALGLKAVGRIHEALPLYKRALEMCERIHGEADHPDLVIRIGNYALGLKAVGRIHEALPLYKRALEICERIHGDADHPSLECCINNYASGLDTAGRINEALPLYNRALEMCERIHGEADHPDLVIRIGNYALGLKAVGRIHEALPLYKRALEICERIHGEADHPDLDRCINNYALGLDDAGRINEALPFYKRALEMCERIHGDADHPSLECCINNYASGLQNAGRIHEALPLYKRALEMCERIHGEADHPDLVIRIGNYALGLQAVGRVNEALPLYKRALEMCERIHGEADHPDLVIRIGNYALGLKAVGRIHEALPLYKRALEMCERIHGEADHPDLVIRIGNYALGLKAVGRIHEALPLYKRALEMCERIHGEADHPSLVNSIGNYASGLDDAGRINEALPLYERALEMCERIHGEADHPDLDRCINNYALGLDDAGRINEALPFYKRALEMCERIHGEADHPDLDRCINNYALGLDDAGRINEALPFYKRALEMCERIHGEADHPSLVNSIGNYASGLDTAGRINEALPLYKRALEMCERIHGDADHPYLERCINNYASGLQNAGRIHEALPLYKRALEMCERIHGEADHPSLVTSIGNYALGLQAVGRVNEALPLYKRALEMCERIHGDADHPYLERCIGNYALGLKAVGRIHEALPLYKRALEMCERIHGEADHPDLVIRIGNYALGLKAVGRIHEALPLYKRALEMCERIHGEADHPSLVNSIGNYASGLDDAGRINEALPLYERALEMCERIHGDADHPDLVIRIGNYALGLDDAGRINEALPLYNRAMEMCERIHGEADHPSLVTSIGNYASGLDDAGRINEALPLYKRALEMCERIHGDADHLDLERCMRIYANCLVGIGRGNEASPYLQKVDEMLKRLSDN